MTTQKNHSSDGPKTALIIPTFNGGIVWKETLAALREQDYVPDFRLVIDSGSRDDTASSAEAAGFKVVKINSSDFDHGRTRQLGANLSEGADILIYLTQDAILGRGNSLSLIVGAFDDPRVGAAYGRQRPRRAASPIEAHARLFNYPEASHVREMEDATRYGFKAAFLSNSFAAYRAAALGKVNGFPEGVIFGEDSCIAAKMLLEGWKIAYCAEADAFHSHGYTFLQEFQRYFDIGVFHTREKWMLEAFGKPTAEGQRFIVSELTYLLANAPWMIPSALARTLFKIAGYKLGRFEKNLPLPLKLRLTMNKRFWNVPPRPRQEPGAPARVPAGGEADS